MSLMVRHPFVFVLLLFLAGLLFGCQPGRTRETMVFAVVSNVLVAQDGASPEALAESAADRLARAIREINDTEDIRFVVFLGNVIGDGQTRSLDRLGNALRELTKPYYVVLGPEGLAAETESTGEAEGAAAPAVGRSFLVWTFRDHGFNGPRPYWRADVGGGLVLVALSTAAPGKGSPGHVDAEQLKWLDQTLAACPNDAVAILCYHALQPFDPLDNSFLWQHHLVDNRDEVLEVIGRHRNVTMALSASHRFAAGRTVGNVLHLAVPGLSVWPLAYDVIRLSPQEAEYLYIPIGTDDETRSALDRLVADETIRKLFGATERSEQRVIQVFGGRKTQVWNLSTMRP